MNKSKNFILLGEEERTQLEEFLTQENLSDRQKTRANVLLLADIGQHGPGVAFTEIEQRFDLRPYFVSQLVKQAMEKGAFEVATGKKKEGDGRGKNSSKTLFPETESEISALAQHGEFSQKELGKKYGISQRTVSDIIRRNEPPSEDFFSR